ncbi:MAG: hypothetical protein HZA15_10550 [Nitrospirae bacterium]|nr:hypothetical protein [Nitrospirota bacterium]
MKEENETVVAENPDDRIYATRKTPQTLRKHITAVDRFKKNVESSLASWEYGDIFRTADSIKGDLFYKIASPVGAAYYWKINNELANCIHGDVTGFAHRQMAFHDMQQIVMTASMDKPKNPDFGIIEISPLSAEARFPNEIKALRSKPLCPSNIPEALINLYGKLLHLEQQWRSDLFLYELPAAYIGAGKIAVKHFIETLGRIIAAFRNPKTTPEELEAEFTKLEAARSVISAIAKEEF